MSNEAHFGRGPDGNLDDAIQIWPEKRGEDGDGEVLCIYSRQHDDAIEIPIHRAESWLASIVYGWTHLTKSQREYYGGIHHWLEAGCPDAGTIQEEVDYDEEMSRRDSEAEGERMARRLCSIDDYRENTGKPILF